MLSVEVRCLIDRLMLRELSFPLLNSYPNDYSVQCMKSWLLCDAIQKNDLILANKLLNTKAKIMVSEACEMLQETIVQATYEMFSLFVKSGFYCVEEENTDLICCIVEAGNFKLADAMIEKGFKVDVDVLSSAWSSYHPRIIPWLSQKGKNIPKNEWLVDAIDIQHIEMVRELIKLNAVPEKEDLNRSLGYDNFSSKEKSLVMLALEMDANDITRYLISFQQDLNVAEKNTRDTALHIAAERGNLEMAQCLVEAGANVHQLNTERFSPYDSAWDAGHKEVAAYLLQQEALHARDENYTQHILSNS